MQEAGTHKSEEHKSRVRKTRAAESQAPKEQDQQEQVVETRAPFTADHGVNPGWGVYEERPVIPWRKLANSR